MGARFEELDWRRTPMGEISLRRRHDPALGVDVHEVKLGDEFLMSSLFVVAEEELARLALAALPGDELDVVVGGLGLGYTAAAVLDDPRVRSLAVLEALPAVVDWHEQGLVPLGPRLTADPRCRLVLGDFFALTAGDGPLVPGGPERVHAVIVDIDHSPRQVLHATHGGFYTGAGLQRVVDRLHDGGVFALWSDEPPDEAFLPVLRSVLPDGAAHAVAFDNPVTGGRSSNTVYVGRRG